MCVGLDSIEYLQDTDFEKLSTEQDRFGYNYLGK